MLTCLHLLSQSYPESRRSLGFDVVVSRESDLAIDSGCRVIRKIGWYVSESYPGGCTVEYGSDLGLYRHPTLMYYNMVPALERVAIVQKSAFGPYRRAAGARTTYT